MTYTTYYEADKALKKLRKNNLYRELSEHKRWEAIKKEIARARREQAKRELAEARKTSNKTRRPRKKKEPEKEPEITEEEFEKLVRKYNL
jgi:hypothetical protein